MPVSRDKKGQFKKTHGFGKTHFYHIWGSMISRCKNKNNKNYGGRGIIVCERWQDFMNFKEDMHLSYLEHYKKFGGKETTIERISVDGNYELKNCIWATWREQRKNKRKGWKMENRKIVTKAKGYYFHKPTGKFCTQIRIKDKKFHIGLFKTKIEARNAYIKELKKIILIT